MEGGVMNRQGPGKIGWTDYTLNIVTGCEYNCDYGPDGCYANKLSQFLYPEKFKPTFRPNALKDKDLGRVQAGSKIFLSNMGDAFGDWVPSEWIVAQIKLAEKYPQYIFQFLTKNPRRYEGFSFPSNCWLGATWDSLQRTRGNIDALCTLENDCIKYVSFEPLLGHGPNSLPVDSLDWIIIGELTGKQMSNIELEKVQCWAEEIINQARELSIPVFVKNALGAIFPQREFPKVR
jgi:protein gp37